MSEKDPYEIPVELAESAHRLIGKSLVGNGNRIEIVKWVGKNYILRMPDGSERETPVMWVLQNVNQNKIAVE